MESSTPNLDYLREQVTQLKGLLDNPHPGMATWCAAYARNMKAINDFWKIVRVPSSVNSSR